jgi:cephalosporin hydroxylase
MITNNYNYNLSTIYGDPYKWTGHFAVTYKGVPYLKCPFDYTLYQMVIMNVQPDLIIEIGTYRGGGSLYYADLLYLLGGDRMVHTINIENQIVDEKVSNHPMISFFYDGYQNYDLNLTKPFEKVLIIDDGSHSYEDVKGALSKFSQVVSKDSYFIVEDGIVTQLGIEESFGGGPTKAIEEFIDDNHEFEVDRGICDFFGLNATFNPNGFLKKIK